ncbi:MAG: class I SAM-dependent methyltransferase [Acidobacteria bacterium]|nr:class I SAM-dependent methyltransferase [Acidobacteriota bacterium]MBP8273613.1 class I SAM-dependent methyltransferase [Acidobacteriota bacterium]
MDVAIVSYNTDFYLFSLLVSLREHLPSERVGAVHVWDNHSTDATSAMLAAFARREPRLHVHRSPANIQHGPALDRLLRFHCTDDWVLVLDADTEILSDATLHLPDLTDGPPVFVGQIHPQMPHLYAYLSHLLLHRPSYLTLPPFRDDGAPGDRFFHAIEAQQRPYRRFRWCDHVSHAGQAALRELHARGETSHPLYDFAAAEVRKTPSSDERLAREARLRQQLAAFLDSQTPTVSSELPSATLAPVAIGEGDALCADVTDAESHSAWSWRDWVSAVVDPGAARALYRARRIGLVQRHSEIRALFQRVKSMRPRRVVEIGTAYGGSLYLWTRAAADDAVIVSVDLPPWERDDAWEAQKVAQFRRFARRDQAVTMIRASSHDPASLAAVREAMGGEPIDVLFIDGDHSLDGVRQDVADYGPLVRAGGIIALHDIHPHSRGWGGDVPQLWPELAATHRTRELIENRAQDGFGIGVVWM